MKDKLKLLIRSMLAGICIALGSAIYLKLGGVVGAVMFAFGLLTVVHFKLPLYTGTAGFIDLKEGKEYVNMLWILVGNIIGCLLFAFMPIDGIGEGATAIVQARMDAGYYNCFMRSIGCGLIMTLIVQGGRDKNQLLILFGIPLFILLGFYHSIADAAYIGFNPDWALNGKEFGYYLTIVAGNFVGCNVPRLLNYKL